MSIILQTPSNGSITLSEQDTASNITVTIPATTGTLLTTATAGVPIGGPAFSAYASSGTSCANATATKVLFQVENFDTNNCFASSTFTPTVAGYYQINSAVAIVTSAGLSYISIYKNNAAFNIGNQAPNSATGIQVSVSSLVYMNGTTDYLEIFFYQGSGSTATTYTTNNNQFSYFNGCLVRSAT